MKAFVSLLIENGSQVHPSHMGALALASALALAPVGCSSAEPSVGADAGGTFTAYQADFQTYRAWQSFTFEGKAVPDSPHAVAGVRTEYINHLPPKGATAFPVGTIIVKVLDDDPALQTFAMVKVGGGYNPDGAKDWEWYELLNDADESVTIRWNGAIAPQGDPYASSPVSCNDCHSQAASTDYVQSGALNLARLNSGAPFDGGVLDALDGASE